MHEYLAGHPPEEINRQRFQRRDSPLRADVGHAAVPLPLYSRWHHLHKSSPSAPTWADFRASQDAPAKRATVELKQYPGLLSPLSLRSQQQVQRKVSIRIDSATEHQASMTKRQKLAKAAI